ncbi:hypothetical protein ACGF12_22785 [Kitasatospora sp. NPDC048296]|uniref:hypothetical protein n=1 Tax=Kitasatospora sp. NPDC048296 TaxID=3364048 RepID=UPI0037218319
MSTFVAFSDSVEKEGLVELTATEARAVHSVRAQLEVDPRTGERRPSYDPQAEDYVVHLDEGATGGRPISILHRYHRALDFPHLLARHRPLTDTPSTALPRTSSRGRSARTRNATAPWR